MLSINQGIDDTMMRQGPEYETERKRAAGAALDLAREFLDDKRTKRQLGHFAERLMAVSAMAEVPDVIDGSIQELADYRERDTFPMLVARAGEKFTTDMMAPMPLQLRFMPRFVKPQDAEEMKRATGSANHKFVSRADGLEMLITTFSITDESNSREKGKAYGRPMIFLRNQEHDRPEMALTVIHELSHAHDDIERPAVMEDELAYHLRTELKAYTMQGRVQSALRLPNEGYEYVRDLETIRRRYNGSHLSKRAFYPSDQIRHALWRKKLTRLYKP